MYIVMGGGGGGGVCTSFSAFQVKAQDNQFTPKARETVTLTLARAFHSDTAFV